jgi:hypothetical protein
LHQLGGAAGIAAPQTLLTIREPFHSNVLTPAVSPFNEPTLQPAAAGGGH